MQRLISIIGSKGGTGKTSASHMLCHGLGLLGRHSIYILTDTEREPLSRSGRQYVTLDGRSPEQLEKILEKLVGMPNWLGVIDGGANRPDFDLQLYELEGLVLLPFRDSHEDMRTVRRDLGRFPNALGLPSQWPTNSWQQMAAERTLDEMMQSYRPRLLDPVYAVSSSKLLLQDEVPGNLPSILNNVSRSFARQVLDRLGLTYFPDKA
jgi:hypothetical protein